jgi:outer membrane protein
MIKNQTPMKFLSTLFFCLITFPLLSQEALQTYIRQGLENNLALKQKETDFRKSLEALKEARGLFYPSVSVNARYTVSEGGRVIDFPVGDLLNPVYSTLNQLTSSSSFPQVENQQIRFLRPTEQETKLHLVQPVINSDLYYNAKIKKEMTAFEATDVEQYKRELIAEIKKGYYAVGMTSGIVSMLQNTRQLLVENVRVNTSLVEHDKITRDNLLRSQTELSKFDQQLLEAGKSKELSVAYFNFLLNRPLTDSVVIELPADLTLATGIADDYTRQAVENREEIKNLERYNHISDLSVSMNRSSRLPNLVLVADYGFQGEKYVFNKNQDFLQASVVLNWTLFSGLQNKAKISQALIDKEHAKQQLDEVKNKIALQVISALNEVRTSEAALVTAESQVKTAREGFRLIRRRYEEGQANLLEFMDARSTLTQAEENLIVKKYDYLSNYAEFEKVIAGEKL